MDLAELLDEGRQLALLVLDRRVDVRHCFGICDLRFAVCGVGFRVWGMGFGVWGLELRVEGIRV